MKLRRALDNMCKSCIYDPHPGNGTWRQQVEDCPSTDCPLYQVRPITGETRRRNKQIEMEE